ncbi:MAG: hypothetical protein KC656_14690 [Myxococcales bacterium]|nr:hypothetical protein [Myxococcales bacterium]MCB9672923.1 hypothetical protein [Alphaproteobacteria bacterium]
MDDPGRRLLHALELMEMGLAMQRQNLRRRHPEWSEAEVDGAMRRWVSREDEPLPWPLRYRPR